MQLNWRADELPHSASSHFRNVLEPTENQPLVHMESESETEPRRLEEGPLRKLRRAELQLLEDLGLHEQEPMSYTKVVWGVEVLLLASAAMLFLTMHLAGELDQFSPLDALQALFTSQGNPKDREMEVDLRNEHSLRNFHVMASMVGHVVLVPQLVILVLVAEEKTSMVLQLILTVVILLTTGVTQAVQKTITAGKEETCRERRTCAHNSWGWYFFINNIWFSATVLIRLLFNLRWRTWLTGLRVVGPLLAFLTSRKCREFQALCLMACLGATTLSGLVLHTAGLSREGKAPSTGTIVAASLTCLFTFAALSLLLAAYLLPHSSFNHRNVVSEAELKAALERVGEAHRQELSRRWWDGRYSPFTGAREARLPPQQIFSEQL